jgi:hypothetical protein
MDHMFILMVLTQYKYILCNQKECIQYTMQ